MTLFLISIWSVGREFIDALDSIRQMLLSIVWWFQGLQLLCFHQWFMDQPWQSIFENSMRQPWLYFCYAFDASVVNSATLSIRYVGCYSVFINDFKVYSVSVFTNDLWIRRQIPFLTIPFVGRESIFGIDLLCRSWIHWRYRLHKKVVAQYSLTIKRSTVTLFSLANYGSAVT
jgi:hypothetical protein